MTIYVPYTLVPSLAGNTSFDQVDIEAGTISSGTLSLDLIGSNANMSYVFASGFTVAAGATMAVGAQRAGRAGVDAERRGGRDLLQRRPGERGRLSGVRRQRRPDRQRHHFHQGGNGAPTSPSPRPATLSGGTNSFNLPIYVPYTLVPSLAGNTSFDQVDIEAGTISSGTLALDLIGRTRTLSYVFASGFTVAAGGRWRSVPTCRSSWRRR